MDLTGAGVVVAAVARNAGVNGPGAQVVRFGQARENRRATACASRVRA